MGSLNKTQPNTVIDYREELSFKTNTKKIEK